MPSVDPDCSHQERLLFLIGLLVFFGLLAGPVAAVFLTTPLSSSPLDLLYLIALPMLSVGVAFDTTELTLSLVLRPRPLPKTKLDSFPRVALLMTVCDDVFQEALKNLGLQSYPNFSVFILDDSLEEEERTLVDRAGYVVLRRGTRQGYKAGNLNFWLDTYGSDYKYFVILDSDSIIHEDFIERMVEYAEHPLNRCVAVFQSKIIPWNTARPFPRFLGALAPLRMHILERVANRTGTMLSLGHNNMMRTASAQQVGGFHEYLTAEDTVLTLMLSAIGHAVKLVDVTSYEAEPRDLLQFEGRTVRWAKQTVELFRLPWRRASFRLKSVLSYHLYSYSVSTLSLCLLIAAVFCSIVESSESKGASIPTGPATQMGSPSLTMIALVMYFWAIPMVLRFVLAVKTRVPIHHVLAHSLLCVSLGFCLSLRIAAAMVCTALGGNVSFRPTNAVTANHSNQQRLRWAIVGSMLPSLATCALILLEIAQQQSREILGFSGIWLGLFFAAPFILCLFHLGSRSRENFQ